MELMVKNLNILLDKLSAPGIDCILYWPYDEGGCACKQCAPWGTNGYPVMCRKFSAVVRAKYPKAKFIMATWLFDFDKKDEHGRLTLAFKTDGEYAGIDKFLKKDKSWVDYLMVDAHEDFPEYPLTVGVPGNLPMVNFPEICMWGQDPLWGGFGANPLPGRFQRLWDQAKDKLVGGVPYSEGIFDDINKVVYIQFYWDPNRQAAETLKEYIGYEYSPNVADDVMKSIEILEHNHISKIVVDKRIASEGYYIGSGVALGGTRVEYLNPDRTPMTPAVRYAFERSTSEALNLMQQADAKLTPHARAGWRWRILYLRTLIDHELSKTNGWFQGATLKMAFEELTRIYHSENATYTLHVPRIDDADVNYSGK